MTKKDKAKKQKILLVEDDTFLSGMYVSKLDIEGFETVLASEGKQGLKMVKQENPDLILLDIILPKMDGFEILKEIRKDKKTKDIPVILLTNLGQKKDVDKAFNLGAVDYLIKAHFMPSEVVEKIKKTLRKE
ncbi:MAG: response regulator [Patescibacteria group bacterium]|nr:response regulator [Patescibacteria group bacterium]